MNRRQRLFVATVAATLVALAASRPSDCRAAPGAESPDEAELRKAFAPPDRTVVRLLDSARQLTEQGRYAESVRCLGAILESPQDYFYLPDEGASAPRSLKVEAERLLGTMSRRGRDLYELQYGARARQLLREAVLAGSAAGLAEVSRRFFHTEAGYEATLLLGLDHLNRGRPLAGALALERLRQVPAAAERFEPGLSLAAATSWMRAGMPDKARQVLADLRARAPDALLEVGDRDVPIFAEGADPLVWLSELIGPPTTSGGETGQQWPMFRGNAARNGSSPAGGVLLNRRWQVSTADHPLVGALIEQIAESDSEWERPALPALAPIAVRDTVLMRTTRNLLALDSQTGKRLWEVPVDDPLATLFDATQNTPFRRLPQIEISVRLRMWSDATFGKLSSDGERVFAVEDLQLEMDGFPLHALARNLPRIEDASRPAPHNRLAAYDVDTGKLVWHVGGPERDAPLPLAGSFFLGPPLPLTGRLYAIAEAMGEIRLIVLDGKSGELLWSQQLAGTDLAILKDPQRRMAGISPSYADGVLVCPTGSRSIVAVDLATRSLLWGYAYPEAEAPAERQTIFFGGPHLWDAGSGARWSDSSAVVAEGRVLVTPIESDALHCLSLVDGQLLWREPRGDDLYLACVYGGKAVLVGRSGLRAVALQNPEHVDASRSGGRPVAAWDGRTVAFPAGAMPSGMGYLSGNRYYVPLSTAEVLAVDLDAAEPVASFASRDGHVPGNLVGYRGRILSQTASGLEAFDDLSALREQVDRRLAADPGDAEAEAHRGEILWHDGNLPEAIECFRRSYGLAPTAKTRQLLRDALFEGLRTQFAAHRDDVDEIEGLIDEAGQRAAFLRLKAAGLERAGEHGAAWHAYWKLIDLEGQRRELKPVDASLLIRHDRWIRGRVEALHETAPPEVREEIDRVAAERLRAALNRGGAEAIERFLDDFDFHPIAAQARLDLVRKYEASGDLLAAELLLQEEEKREGTPEGRGRAVARLADVLRRAKRWDDATVCYRRLQKEFAETVCLDEKTGSRIVEGLAEDDPVRLRLARAVEWPIGEVVVTKSTAPAQEEPIAGRPPVPLAGESGPFLSATTIGLQQRPPQLVARDGLGRRRWSLSLMEVAPRSGLLLERGWMRYAACGHLLLFSNGQSILAVDALGVDATGSPRVLWHHDLDQPADGLPVEGRLRVRLANLAGLGPAPEFARQSQEPSQTPGALGEQVFCFVQSRNCVAVDPRTGQTLWIRQNVPRDGEVFGDREHVFVVSPKETTATVYRAADGEHLGQREIPVGSPRMFFGRRVLIWRRDGSRRMLEMIDAWESRRLWPVQEYSSRAGLRQVDDNTVAVYEGDGRLVLVQLADGRALVDTRFTPEPVLNDALVFPSPRGYVAVAYDSRGTSSRNLRRFQLQNMPSVRVNRGQVLAFDRRGKVLWDSPVTVQDQWLPLDQPRDLPVLTFASLAHNPEGGQTRSSTSILCIDNRTGRRICQEEFSHAAAGYGTTGDPETTTVAIALPQVSLTLEFTDNPVPAEPIEREPASTKPTVGEAIWRALRAAAADLPSR